MGGQLFVEMLGAQASPSPYMRPWLALYRAKAPAVRFLSWPSVMMRLSCRSADSHRVALTRNLDDSESELSLTAWTSSCSSRQPPLRCIIDTRRQMSLPAIHPLRTLATDKKYRPSFVQNLFWLGMFAIFRECRGAKYAEIDPSPPPAGWTPVSTNGGNVHSPNMWT